MNCPFCNSSDIATIQGQLYCINCGRQINPASAKAKDPTPSPEVTKIANDMQAEVAKTLKGIDKPAKPETKEPTPLALQPEPKEATLEKADQESVKAPSTQIINHSKGKESPPPKQAVSNLNAVEEPIKEEPKLELKDEPKPESIKQTEAPKSKHKKRHLLKKKRGGAKPVVLTAPEPKTTANIVKQSASLQPRPKSSQRSASYNLVIIPAITSALLISLPIAVLQLRSSPAELSKLASSRSFQVLSEVLGLSLVSFLVIGGLLAALICIYRLYVIGIIAAAASAKLDGKLNTPHDWRRASTSALGRVIGLELIVTIFKVIFLGLLILLASTTLKGSEKLSLLTISLLVIGNFIALLALFTAFATKQLARCKLVLSSVSIAQSLASTWRDFKEVAAEIFVRWIGTVILEAAIWAPYLYLVLNPGQFSSSPVVGPLTTFIVGAVSGTLSLFIATRFWLGRYRALLKP